MSQETDITQPSALGDGGRTLIRRAPARQLHLLLRLIAVAFLPTILLLPPISPLAAQGNGDDNPCVHVVRSGDLLGDIFSTYQLSDPQVVEAVEWFEADGGRPDLIRPGQEIRIPPDACESRQDREPQANIDRDFFWNLNEQGRIIDCGNGVPIDYEGTRGFCDLDVLANDWDPDRDNEGLEIVGAAPPNYGEVSADTSRLRYFFPLTTADDAPQAVSFGYTIADDDDNKATSQVVITLSQVDAGETADDVGSPDVEDTQRDEDPGASEDPSETPTSQSAAEPTQGNPEPTADPNDSTDADNEQTTNGAQLTTDDAEQTFADPSPVIDPGTDEQADFDQTQGNPEPTTDPEPTTGNPEPTTGNANQEGENSATEPASANNTPWLLGGVGAALLVFLGGLVFVNRNRATRQTTSAMVNQAVPNPARPPEDGRPVHRNALQPDTEPFPPPTEDRPTEIQRPPGQHATADTPRAITETRRENVVRQPANRQATTAETDDLLVLGDPSRGSRQVPEYAPWVSRFVPAQIADEGMLGGLVFRAVSAQGAGHRHGGEPRQDSYALATTQDQQWMIMAVADGLGSATHSHLGSKRAAEFACRQLAAMLLEADHLTSHFLEQVDNELMQRFGERSAEIATTLLVVAVNVNTAQCLAFRVGDTELLIRSAEGWQSIFGAGPSTSGMASTATSVLPGQLESKQETSFRLADGDVLMLATDGVADPIASAPKMVGEAFVSRLAAPPSLADFVKLVRFDRKGAVDDRTAVAFWWNSQPNDR